MIFSLESVIKWTETTAPITNMAATVTTVTPAMTYFASGLLFNGLADSALLTS